MNSDSGISGSDAPVSPPNCDIQGSDSPFSDNCASPFEPSEHSPGVMLDQPTLSPLGTGVEDLNLLGDINFDTIDPDDFLTSFSKSLAADTNIGMWPSPYI